MINVQYLHPLIKKLKTIKDLQFITYNKLQIVSLISTCRIHVITLLITEMHNEIQQLEW